MASGTLGWASRHVRASAQARRTAICSTLGAQVRAARLRRRWTTERLARETGLSRALVYLVERGDPTTIETYARFGTALGMRLEASLQDPHEKARPGRAEDPVHAAIVEGLVARYEPRDASSELTSPSSTSSLPDART